MKLWNKSPAIHSTIPITGFLFCFFLPFNTKLSNVLLIIFLVSALIYILKGDLVFKKTRVPVIKYSTLILIIPLVFSIFFHGEFIKVMEIFGRRVSYLLIPLALLFFASDQLLALQRSSLRGIIYGSFLSSIFLLVNNFSNYYATRPLFCVDTDLLNFYYTGFNFTEILDFHPSYYGMFILFSISILLFNKVFNLKLLTVTIFFLLSLTIFFLSSRIILFFYFLIVVVYIFRLFFKLYGKTKKAVLAILLISLGIFTATYFTIRNTYIYTSLTQEAIWDLTFNINDKYNSKTSGDSRMARWDVAMDLIGKQALDGYGIGNEKDILEKSYRKEGMVISAENRYDAHNLFLGYSLETGISGMLVLVYYIFISLFLSFKYKRLMYFLFFLSIFGMCLIENYLNNNAAITFVAFFGNLFLFQTLLKVNSQDEVSQNSKVI